MNILDVPEDIIYEILFHLDPLDIYNLYKTCSALKNFIHNTKYYKIFRTYLYIEQQLHPLVYRNILNTKNNVDIKVNNSHLTVDISYANNKVNTIYITWITFDKFDFDLLSNILKYTKLQFILRQKIKTDDMVSKLKYKLDNINYKYIVWTKFVNHKYTREYKAYE